MFRELQRTFSCRRRSAIDIEKKTFPSQRSFSSLEMSFFIIPRRPLDLEIIEKLHSDWRFPVSRSSGRGLFWAIEFLSCPHLFLNNFFIVSISNFLGRKKEWTLGGDEYFYLFEKKMNKNRRLPDLLEQTDTLTRRFRFNGMP